MTGSTVLIFGRQAVHCANVLAKRHSGVHVSGQALAEGKWFSFDPIGLVFISAPTDALTKKDFEIFKARASAVISADEVARVVRGGFAGLYRGCVIRLKADA